MYSTLMYTLINGERMRIKLMSVVLMMLILWACSSDTGNLEDKEKIAASNLVYMPSSITFIAGDADKVSSQPTITEGSSATTGFSLTNTITGISINDTNGIVTVTNTIAIGTHTVSVTVANDDVSENFPDVFSVIVKALPTAPVSLSYSANPLVLEESVAGSSSASVNNGGSAVIAFSELTPFPAGFTLNTTSGTISVDNTVTIGSYKLSVSVTNVIGKADFTDALTVNVTTPVPKVTFDADIKPIIQSKCSSCHTGGNQPNFTSFTIAKNSIDDILNRIQRTQGSTGFMPQGGSKIPQSEIDKIKQWKTDGLLEN
jgi:hypothetical protein